MGIYDKQAIADFVGMCSNLLKFRYAGRQKSLGADRSRSVVSVAGGSGVVGSFATSFGCRDAHYFWS